MDPSADRQVVVLLNAGAGNGAAGSKAGPEDVRRAFAAAEVPADIRPVPGERLADEARRAAANFRDDVHRPAAPAAPAAPAVVVVAAGGDGTVSAVASALAGT